MPKEGLPGGLRFHSRFNICPVTVTAALCCHLLSSASRDLRNQKRHRREGEYSIKANIRVGGDGAGCAVASVHTARTAPNPKSWAVSPLPIHIPGWISGLPFGVSVAPSNTAIPHCCSRIPFLNPSPQCSETTSHVCPALRAESIPKVR